jgi:hypothetical protein
VNRVEILEQVRRFKRRVVSLPDTRIKIEGEEPMTEAQAETWIQEQSKIQCPHCGTYYERKK